jgi:hypothetical protein
MKTILVVYSNERVDASTTKLKRYAFNTEADVEVGDVLGSNAYDTMMVVVKVLEEKFNFYNASTGELSKDLKNTKAFEIKTLKIVDGFEDVVYATKVSVD